MTPDEFDQKRRELIRMRDRTYHGNEAVRERVHRLIGILANLLDPVSDKHKADLEFRRDKLMDELSRLTTSQ